MTTSTLSKRPKVWPPDTPATCIGTFEPGSNEWHELRKTGIGGSDIGAIAGLSKWSTFYSVWAQRTGRVDYHVTQNEAMEWGNRLEPVIIDKFADQHPELTLVRDVGTWSRPDRPWQHANPDALFVDADGNWGVLEIKTAQYEDEWTDGPPPHYEAQVQWYLSTMGFDRAYIAVLFHGNRYQEHLVLANKLGQESMLDVAQLFLEYVADEKQPEFDGATATYEAVRASHPAIESGGEVLLDDELELLYWTARRNLDDAEEQFNKVRSRILDAMGTAQRGYIGDTWTFTRTARNGGTPYLTVKKG